jgi:Nickel responsive protein SCO4226-like
MARRAPHEELHTYLVEHYRPGLTVAELCQWAERVRDSASRLEEEGKAVRYVRSAIVPADESLLCVLEAATEELVRETYARAGIPFERLSTVIPEGERGWAAPATSGEEEER